MKKKQLTFTISAISRSCGILPQTIRTWEKRYQVFTPIRSSGGQRLYSENDFSRAKLISRLLDHGQTISKLASLSLEELKELTNLTHSHNSGTEITTLSSIGIRKLLQLLSQYNIEGVASELQHVRMSAGAKDFIFKIVLPVMNEIGNLVYKQKYTVTQEHIISTIVRDQLGQIHLPNIDSEHHKIALATPEGNIHELSILIANIICRSNRYNTSYLGAAHPAECLAEAVNALKCHTIVLGTVSSDQWNYHEHIIPYLKKVDEYLKYEVNIMLGGGLDKKFPTFKMIKEVKIVKTFEDFDNILQQP